MSESPLGRYKKPRKLVRWDSTSSMNIECGPVLIMDTDEKRELAMMALIQNATQRGLDLDWDYAAKQVDPDCTGDAFKQQLNKRRERLINEGAAVAPLTSTRSRRNPKATVSVQHHMPHWNGAEVNPSLFLGQGHGHLIPDASSATNYAISQTCQKRQRSDSSEQPPGVLKQHSHDDAYVDNGNGEMHNSEDDVSDWASGKPAKKKLKRGRPSKNNSLMVTLKTQKKDEVSASSKTRQTPSSGKRLTKSKEETATDQPEGYSKGYAYSLGHQYPAGFGQSAIGFPMAGPPAMTMAMNQDFGNPGMMNISKMAANPAALTSQYGGARFNHFVNPGYHACMGPAGQILGAANSQFEGFNINSNSPAWPQNISQFNYGAIAQPSVQMDTNGQYNIQPFNNLSLVHNGKQSLFNGERIRSSSDPTNFNPQILGCANSVLVAEEGTIPTKEWDFPNARVDTPTFKDDISRDLEVKSKSYFRDMWQDPFSNNQLGSSMGIQSSVAPAWPLPVEVHTDKGNAISPADSTVFTPQTFSFSQTTNAEEKAADTPGTPQMNSNVEENALGTYESPPQESFTDLLTFDSMDLPGDIELHEPIHF